MTDKNKNLIIRIVSALVLLPVVLYLLYRGGYWTATLLLWAGASSAGEYIQITLKKIDAVGWLAIAGAGSLPFFVVWQPYQAAAIVCGVLGVVLFVAWVWHLLRGPHAEAPARVGHLMTAVVYCGGGVNALMATRNLPDGGWWLVCTLVITWMNDTAAYFTGRAIGKHKLYPEVSPNKTWEGFFGGMAGSVLGLVIVRVFFFHSITLIDCVVMGVLGGVLGPAGDLCESMLKRAYGVKDSGKMIPGHGGMLDRIDALLFNAPMVLLWVQFARPLFS
jgi:phosphatidate cytidylyltransferase